MVRLRDDKKIISAYKATLKLITEIGFAGLTMQKIAKKAGVATGTLYIYFKNKNELVNKLYGFLHKRAKKNIYFKIVETPDFEAGLRLLWKNYLTNRIKRHDESVFLEQFYRSPFIQASQKELYEDLKQPALEFLQQGIDQGVIIKVQKEIILSILLGSLRELALEHVEGRILLDEETMNLAFDISYKSLKK